MPFTATCWPKRHGAPTLRCWAYCLMPNHVHLIVVPADEDGLRRDFRRHAPALHRLYQRASPLDRPFVAGPLRGGGDG